MKTLVVATSFREFRGIENDYIQYHFLSSLKRVKGFNVKLIVTIFNEKNVEKNVKLFFKDAVFIKNTTFKKKSGIRYSQTEVFANGIKYSKIFNADFFCWTTCDIILPENFLMDLPEAVNKESCLIISHPHRFIDENGFVKIYPITVSGLDFLVFSRPSLIYQKLYSLNKKYPNYNWGLFEHFLVAFSEILNLRRFNISGRSQIIKFENKKEISFDSKAWTDKSWKRNAQVLDILVKKYNLSILYIYSCWFMSFKCSNIFYIFKPINLFAIIRWFLNESFRIAIKKLKRSFYH